MRLLLDTHIVFWAMIDDPRLSAHAKALIDDQRNETFISVVSLWEIALKRASKPISTPITLPRARAFLDQAGVRSVSLNPRHVDTYLDLPLRHRDPFDRMIIAQALEEPLRLVTHDRNVAGYSDSFILI